jgi:phosphoglycolate phosphatase-like HAD superfamily hydrolase
MANSIQSISLPAQAQAGQINDRFQQQPKTEKSNVRPVNEDSVELRKPTPQQVINDQIMQAIGELNGYLKTEGFQTIEQLDPAEFTPEKVSDRILNFIDLAIKRAENNGADSSELEKMREQARAGVEDGYNKAYDMLEGLGLMEGKVKEDVEKTYELLQQGLGRMDRGEPLILAEEAEDSESLGVMAQAESRSLSLQIQTRDGDTVTIDLQRSSSSASLAYEGNSEEGRFSVNLQQRQSEFSFQYQVDGSLDKDEEQAIKDLLKDIDKLSDDFFAGNTPDLLKTALKNGFDSEELSSFNLQMSHHLSRIAASAYQQVDQMDQPNNRRPATPPGQFLQQWRAINEQAGLALGERFGNPSDLLKGLLAQRLELEPQFDSIFGKDSGEENSETPQSLVEKLSTTVSDSSSESV